MSPSTSPIAWQRHGRAWHPRIDSVTSLEALTTLDPVRWVATSAPTASLSADPTFLGALDADRDGRIRVEDLVRLIRWTLSVLSDRTALSEASSDVRLDALRTDTPEAQALHETARRLLERLGRDTSEKLTLADIRKVRAAQQKQGLSEAGLVLPEATEDAQTQALLSAVLSTVGGEPHPLGKPAVSEKALTAFLAQSREWLAWHDRQQAEAAALMPFGADTQEVFSLLEQLSPKLSQYFTLSQALALDARLVKRVWPGAAHEPDLDLTDSEAASTFLERAPLAAPDAAGLLRLDGPLNPRFAPRIKRLSALVPEWGDAIGASDLAALRSTLTAHAAWRDRQPKTSVAALGAAKLQAFLADEDAAAEVRALLARSNEVAVALEKLHQVEVLSLCQSSLMRTVNSFAAFPDLYDPDSHALFERGTLIMDGRELHLSVPVLDRARHIRFATASNLFVLYVELSDQAGTKLQEVAVPVTSGRQGNLLTDKWGVFHTVDGKELHAKVVHIVDNPISLLEAMGAPFIRIGEAVRKKVEGLGQARTAELEQRALSTSPPSAEQSTALSGGMLAGGGIALAALSSAAAFVTSTLQGIGLEVIAGGLLVLLAAVLLPTALLAWLKLRRRDLSAFLEGSGWGINPRMYLSRQQAKTFTRLPDYPRQPIGALLAVLLLLTVLLWWWL